MKNQIVNRVSNLPAFIFIGALLIFSASCGARKTAYIFVPDLTESVSAEAKAKCFETIKARAKRLKRGDSLTVIPLSADAQIETSGKVLHLEVGEKRELADADLDEFSARAERLLDEMQRGAKSYQQSDVLGALRVVREEIAMIDPKKKRVIVAVLSDMIHSTKEIRFEADARFANAETARKYAADSVGNPNEAFGSSEIYLGFLESSDARKMPNERREAVRQFWQEYFNRSGATRVQLATDGTGQLEKFVAATKDES